MPLRSSINREGLTGIRSSSRNCTPLWEEPERFDAGELLQDDASVMRMPSVNSRPRDSKPVFASLQEDRHSTLVFPMEQTQVDSPGAESAKGTVRVPRCFHDVCIVQAEDKRQDGPPGTPIKAS